MVCSVTFAISYACHACFVILDRVDEISVDSIDDTHFAAFVEDDDASLPMVDVARR